MAVTVITLYFCSVGEWFQMKKTVSSQIWSLHYFILQHILSSPLSSIRPLSSLLFIGLILSPMEIQEHCRDPAGSKGSTTCCAERMVYWCVALLPRFNFPVSYAPLSQNRVSYYLQAAAYLCQHLQSGLTLLILHWLRADTVPFCAVITSGISHTNTQSGAAWRYMHLQDWCSSCVKLIPVPSMAVRLHALLILLEFSSDEAKYTFCLCFLCISNTWYFMLDLSIDSILLKLSN